jgi:thioredoxin-like negative regulator of GroEL
MTTSRKTKFEVTVNDDGTFTARMGRKKRRVAYEEAFSFGHSLMEAGHYEHALRMFSALARTPNRGFRARVMQARCQAELEEFEACNEILKNVFENEEKPVAEELQSAFVYHKLGMTREAMRELRNVVKEHKDLPTACLFLGDLFQEAGSLRKATYCWKLAAQRDRRGGAVAKAAQKQLRRLMKQAKPSGQQPTNEKSKSTP